MEAINEQQPNQATPKCGEMPDNTYQAYLKERGKLLDVEVEYARSYDKYILTLSGGAIALSLAFIRDIVTEPVALAL